MSEKRKIFLFYVLMGLAPIVYFYTLTGPKAPLPPTISDFLKFVPYVGLFLLGVSGWKLNQTRVVWSCLMISVIYYYLLAPIPLNHPLETAQRAQRLQIFSVALPLSLSLLFAINESKLWGEVTLGRLLLALSPFAFLFILSFWLPGDLEKLFFWNLGPVNKNFRFPFLSFISAIPLWLTAYFTKDQKTDIFLMALSAALAPIFFSLYLNLALPPLSPNVTALVRLAFSAVTILLLHAVFRMYWKRVYLDALTGIPNRQSLDERLHTLTGDYSLAMIDVDHFKKFNDTYGHHEGDNVLRMIAKHLEDHFGNQAYRYGGEEFCVVFEGVPLKEAEKLADEARKELENTAFVLRSHLRRKLDDGKKNRSSQTSGKKTSITISAGLAATNEHHQTHEQILKKADKALYQAKDQGRNRVVAQ